MNIANLLLAPLSLFKFLIRKKRRLITQKLALSNSCRKILIPNVLPNEAIGVIAGNGLFPLLFAKEARAKGHKVFAVCHELETDQEIEKYLDGKTWIKLGQLGSLINFFKENNIKYVVMAGGISRVKHFGGVKLDMRGSSLLLKLRSTKDDVIMRGIADELFKEGIDVIPCTIFMQDSVTPLGLLTNKKTTSDQLLDIEVGVQALKAMSGQDIGQLVVVREGTIVAVEAVEGSNEAIKRGAALGGEGTVVVKCAKPTQDMRFDVPTVGLKTIEIMKDNKISVLALEAGRSIIIDKEECIKKANEFGIIIVGISPIVDEVLG